MLLLLACSAALLPADAQGASALQEVADVIWHQAKAHALDGLTSSLRSQLCAEAAGSREPEASANARHGKVSGVLGATAARFSRTCQELEHRVPLHSRRLLRTLAEESVAVALWTSEPPTAVQFVSRSIVFVSEGSTGALLADLANTWTDESENGDSAGCQRTQSFRSGASATYWMVLGRE